jgi:hypothetical protein
MPADLRIPFSEAVEEANLLKPWFDDLSLAQQVSLKIAYGCDLSADKKDDRGWSELDYYYMLAESCVYDELGYLKSVTPIPYYPQEYPEVWMVWGIRAGKSDRAAATIAVYEATCGGHEAYTRKGRPIIVFQIAQDLKMAKYSLHSIKGVLESMPWCAGWVKQVTADRIDLSNGVIIATTPPTIKAIRGYDSPVATLDEVGVWDQESDNANPDFAIYSQVSSRQAQFATPKIVGISSPWSTHGMLYDRYTAGTNGCKLFCEKHRASMSEVECAACNSIRLPHQGRLILHGTTASLGNPLIRKEWLRSQLNADPRVFGRECLSQFQSAVSGFLDNAKLDQAIDRGVISREPTDRNVYIAAMDPAFRHDSFAFCIGHMEPGKGIIVDLVQRWIPIPGASLNPSEVLGEIALHIQRYRCGVVYSDQYQFEALQQVAMGLGFSIIAVDFTATAKADIYGNLKALVSQGRIRLLDDPDTLRELKQLEQKLSQGGTVSIAAPQGQHDDLATVIALMAHKTIWLSPDPEPEVVKPPTPFELCQAQIKKHNEPLDDDW